MRRQEPCPFEYRVGEGLFCIVGSKTEIQEGDCGRRGRRWLPQKRPTAHLCLPWPIRPPVLHGVFQGLILKRGWPRPASLLYPGAILVSFTALYDCMILIPFHGFNDHMEASVEADASIPVSYLPLHHFSRILQDSSSWVAYRYFNLKNCQSWPPSPQSTLTLSHCLGWWIATGPLLTLEMYSWNLWRFPFLQSITSTVYNYSTSGKNSWIQPSLGDQRACVW